MRIADIGKGVLAVLALVVLLTFPHECIEGAQNGLLLWYSKVLPVLLPFFILSSLVTTYVHCSPLLTTLTLGVLCGYPMGAKNIKDYTIQGIYSKQTAQHLLNIASHASPMFLIGYVCTMQLKNTVPLALFLFAIYLPPAVLALYYGIHMSITRTKQPREPVVNPSIGNHSISLDESIEHSLLLICKIGCYIMLYSIICKLLLSFSGSLQAICINKLPETATAALRTIPNIIIPFLTGILEMTTGIANLAQSDAMPVLKIACITAIASFGGCSSISQVYSTIKGTTLSMVPYVICKIVCGIASGLTILLLLR